MQPGLSVLRWSPRVAPGLLTASAWDLLRSADLVLSAEQEHPLADALADARVGLQDLAMTVRRDDAPLTVDGVADHLSVLAADRRVVWVPGPDGDPELLAALAERGASPQTVVGSRDLPGAAVLDLVAVMDRLRSPGGCAWDAEQTHTSLLTYLIEETYETVESIETGDLVGLREELGDLLLQVVFHARIGQEHTTDPWSIDDVARGITDKLVRRHPHVFGSAADPSVTADELDARWDALKTAEKGRTSATDGVPMGQPALSLAAKLHGRAERAGVAPHVDVTAVPAAAVQDELALGDLLLAVAVAARAAGLDAEAALRDAARRHAAAIRALET